MEFTVQKPDFLREISRIQGVVERKNTIPILSNVLLDCKNGKVGLAATDLEVGLKTSFDAEVSKEGSITLSAKKLHEIARALPNAPVKMKGESNHWVTLKCQKSRFRMVGLPKDDFPSLPEQTLDKGIKIPATALKSMIERVLFATTADDARYSLNGTLLILRKGFVALIASDGHRLSFISREMDVNPSEKEIRVVVPRKAMAEIAKLCAEMDDQDVLFGREENHLFFQIGGCMLDCRVLEGSFPNFDKVIPKDNDKTLELGTEDFGHALRRVSLVSDERTRPVKLNLTTGNLNISSQNPDTGEANESLDVDYDGPDMSIGFNAKYLMDFVNVVGTEKVLLSVKNEMSQGLLRPQSGDGQDYKYVIMPMRV
jgi:DNA polymerase-3 subunit beta